MNSGTSRSQDISHLCHFVSKERPKNGEHFYCWVLNAICVLAGHSKGEGQNEKNRHLIWSNIYVLGRRWHRQQIVQVCKITQFIYLLLKCIFMQMMCSSLSFTPTRTVHAVYFQRKQQNLGDFSHWSQTINCPATLEIPNCPSMTV